MRMGNTFSRALDPSKPLLFGDHPLGILQEELWHPSAARLSWQNPLSGTTSDLTSGRSSPSCEANFQNPQDQMTDRPGVGDFSPACVSTASASYQACVATRLSDLKCAYYYQTVCTLGFVCGCVAWYQCHGELMTLHLSGQLGEVMESASCGLQVLRPLMKKRRAVRSRGTGLRRQRTGAVIMRQTVMTHCSPMTCLKMTMMVTIVHIGLHSLSCVASG